MFDRTILTVFLGLLSGGIGGAFGVGGSFIMLPGLFLLGIIPDYKTAVGTVSLFAVMEYYKKKRVDTYISIVLCVTYVFGAYFGSLINNMYSIQFLQYCTALIFFMLSALFFYMAHSKQ
jgi:uncharacterized membrane protein YfcA